jgi:hypothetical protein
MRHAWAWTAGAAVAAASAGMLLAARDARGPLPYQATRAAVERAARRLDADSPEAARRLRVLAGEAETMAGRGDGAAAWAPVLNAAREALLGQRRRRLDLDGEWRQLEPRVTAALAQAWRQTAAPGLERREARWAQQASNELERARALAAGGELGGALEAARQALERTRRVDAAWQALHARFEQPELRRRWRAWSEETIASTRRGPPALVVDKLARRLDVYRDGRRVASFAAELGSRGLAQKLHAGDKATPEGTYRVTEVRTGGQTRYYKALMLDYPNREDLARYREARRRGQVPGNAGAGSLIEIHGHGGQGRDWTDGCVALTDADMDALFRHVRVGTRVAIVGALPDA